MSTYKYKKQFVFGLSVIAIVIFATVLIHAVFYSSTGDITVSHAQNVVIAHGDYPVQLSIPVLKIKTKVQQVGITASGKMAVPTNYTDVGWYKYGAVPGETGSAVIAGHVDDGLALPGVFSNLSSLQRGDSIYITMKDGEVLHYVMVSSQSYDRNASTDQIFNENDNKLLRLITCTGTWMPALGTHDQRLVVTAFLQ